MKPTFRYLAVALFIFLHSSIALSDAPLIWGPNNTARLLNSGDLTAKNGYIYPNTPSPFNVGSIPFATAGTTLSEDNANLYWDNVYQRLSIGTNFTTSKLSISGGDTSINFANASIGLGYSNTGRYSQFIHTRHAAGTGIGNYIDFYTSDGAPFSLYPTNAVFGMTIGNGNVGIGTTAPAQAFDVGAKFQVDSNGNPLKINNVATSFPSAQGLAGTILTNDGSGSLSWTGPGTSVGGPTVTAANTFANGNTYTNDIVNPPPYVAQRFTATNTGNFVSYETKMQNYIGPTGVVLQAELWSDNGLSGSNSNIGSLLASSITTLSDSTLLTSSPNNNPTSSVPSSIYNFTGYPVVSGTMYWVVVRKISGALGANQIFALTNTGTTSPPARAPGNAGSLTATTYFKANVVVGNKFVLSNALNYLDSSFLNYNVDFGGNVLSGVSTPLTSTDVANKAYVDGSIPSLTWTASGSNQYSNVAGNVGIGSTTPAQKFDIAGKFQVNSNGNPLKVNNVATSFPASQGAASTVLLNDGAGNLSWASTPAALPTNIATLSGGTTTLTSSDNQLQYYTLTAASTVKLPQTGIPAGYTFTFYAKGSFDLTVQANNGTNITPANSANQDATIRYGTVTLVANVASPNTVTDWSVANVNEYYSDSNTTSGAFANVVTASYTRNNHVVLLDWCTGSTDASGTPTSSTTLNWGNIPSRFRPSTERTGSTTVSSSAYQGGVVQVSSGGAITIYKSFQFDPLSNAQPSRVFAFSMSWSI